MKYKVELLALSALSGISAIQAKPKDGLATLPNIIFIMADDLGIGDLGCYGQQIIKTPNIDKLAGDGMRFTQHYSGSTVSAPSRCCLLTGKHTGHAFIRSNKDSLCLTDNEKYDYPLKADEVTIAELLKTSHYATACIGKWGLGGPGTEGHPNQQGFDYFFGYLGQRHAHKYFPDFLFENEEKIVLNKAVYSHDLIMDKALGFIHENAKKPFFIYLTPTIPHAELVLPEGEKNVYEGQFPETPYINNWPGGYGSQQSPRATYAGMVGRLDSDVGRILKALQEEGIAENTLVIFTSDNGVHAEGGNDPYFFHSNGSFRGIKRDLYEGGIRTPFIACWPDKISPGSISFHVSAFWDFLPTVCEIAGVKVPKETDGISFLPELTKNGKQKEHAALYWEFHEQGGKKAVLKDNWKLIQLKVKDPDNTYFELYNLSADPGENANVAAQFPDKIAKLMPYLENRK